MCCICGECAILTLVVLHGCVQVIIGNPDLKANHNITQHVEVISEYDKMNRLREMLKTIMTEPGAKVLIFCETKRGCDEITRNLRQDGWPALALHGDKSQKERDWVLLEFKSNRHPLMLATDVAARGLGRQGGTAAKACKLAEPSGCVFMHAHVVPSIQLHTHLATQYVCSITHISLVLLLPFTPKCSEIGGWGGGLGLK